jgi:hypothetical protein
MIVVRAHQVLVDGVAVDDTRAHEATRRLQRLEKLYTHLVSARTAWSSAHPLAPFPGEATYAFEPETMAVVVKSVFQTGAVAGYPNARSS